MYTSGIIPQALLRNFPFFTLYKVWENHSVPVCGDCLILSLLRHILPPGYTISPPPFSWLPTIFLCADLWDHSQPVTSQA